MPTNDNTDISNAETNANTSCGDLKRIDVVGAGAGTGKTYRLVSEFVSRVVGTTNGAEQIIATTFTNKAANELQERIRRELMQAGDWTQAQAILAGYVGTVNSVCGRLVTDLAVDAGLSPSVDVIAEERQAEIFSAATEEIVRAYQSELWDALVRLAKEDEWHKDVSTMTSFARQNNIEAEALRSFAADSWQRLKAHMGLAGSNNEGSNFDAVLWNELHHAIQNLSTSSDNSKSTAYALAVFKETRRGFRTAEDLPWHTWAKLSKTDTATPSKPIISKLKEAAKKHAQHPRLYSDVERLIFGVFDCAADCLGRYQNFKSERGLIDFIDQELIALKTLRQAPIKELLAGKFSTLLVDEFQDTSPIQLAVFLQLASLMESVWVGDDKQSIFSFRGSDPDLMQDCLKTLVPLTQGKTYRLEVSYRSRPSLVDFVNAVFTTAMPQAGITADSVEITEVHRDEDSQLAHPLHFWWLDPNSVNASLDALAHGVRLILQNRQEWPVADKSSTGERPVIRPIKGSDIAILCRSNEHRVTLAQALSQVGLTVATEREKLLDTAECVLALAALRVLVDTYDTLAMAEVIRLTNRDTNQSQWLTTWLLHASHDKLIENFPHLADLVQRRKNLVDSTPTHALEQAITTPFVLETIKRWGKYRQRMLNLDALRGLARSYENLCRTRRSAATPAGLVAFCLSDTNKSQANAHQPPNPDEQAIQVLTYHKSKGLEWPMVILTELDTPLPATPFGVCIENRNSKFDATDPLAGRFIRYWPWPYARQRTDLPLANAVAGSKETAVARRKHAAENMRLLYVGMTRARDYLAFAAQHTPKGTDWLKMIADEQNQPLFSLPLDEGPKPILTTREDIFAHMRMLGTVTSTNGTAQSQELYEHTESEPACPDLPYSCSPSAIEKAGPIGKDGALEEGRISHKLFLGERIQFAASADMELIGNAIHRFIAADNWMASHTDRSDMAQRIIRNWSISDCVSPTDFIEISNRLKRALDRDYPGAVWYRECPIAGRIGAIRMKGSIDLLLELEDLYVIIDHKTFPGRFESWETKALSHFPQLAAYKQLVEQNGIKRVAALYIHMPIVGSLLQLESDSRTNI